MSETEAQRTVREMLNITRAIWILMVAALFPYALVSMVYGSDSTNALNYSVQAGFALYALCIPVVARIQRIRILIKSDPDEMGERFYEILSNRYHTAMVVEMAMIESIGVVGLVLAVLGAANYVYLCFIAYALVLLIIDRPSKKAMWAYLESRR